MVFCYEDGRLWSPSHFSRMFTYHARRLSIDCRLHDLRHSHATQLLGQGVQPKIVSERLGHAKVGFTLDSYAHAAKGMDEEAALTYGRALEGGIRKARDTKR